MAKDQYWRRFGSISVPHDIVWFSVFVGAIRDLDWEGFQLPRELSAAMPFSLIKRRPPMEIIDDTKWTMHIALPLLY